MNKIPQPSLFALDAVRESKHQAIAQVDEHADRAWKDTVDLIIENLARRQPTVTSDDVWRELEKYPDVTHEPSAMGACFIRASRRGILRPTGQYVESRRPLRHGNVIKVWASTLYNGNGTRS
jgi:hypothetical protein